MGLLEVVIIVLLLALVGVLVQLVTTKFQMPPYWATMIQVVAIVLVILILLSRFGYLHTVP